MGIDEGDRGAAPESDRTLGVSAGGRRPPYTKRELDRVIARDHRAVAEFVAYIGPILRGVIRHVLAGQGLSGEGEEDLLQELLCELFEDDAAALRAWDASRGRALENYLRRLAWMRAIDKLRKKRRELLFDETALVALADDTTGATGPEQEGDLAAQLIDRWQQECKPDERRFFEMAFLEGRSADEIATELGLTHPVIYTRKRRMKQRLAAILDELSRRRG